MLYSQPSISTATVPITHHRNGRDRTWTLSRWGHKRWRCSKISACMARLLLFWAEWSYVPRRRPTSYLGLQSICTSGAPGSIIQVSYHLPAIQSADGTYSPGVGRGRQDAVAICRQRHTAKLSTRDRGLLVHNQSFPGASRLHRAEGYGKEECFLLDNVIAALQDDNRRVESSNDLFGCVPDNYPPSSELAAPVGKQK